MMRSSRRCCHKRCACNPWKIYWILHQITLPIEMLITIYYWLLIKPEPTNNTSFSTDYWPHLHPLLAMLLDYSLIHAPYKLRHTQFMIYFSLFYCFGCNMPMALNGDPAYVLITWKSTTSHVFVVVLFVFLMLCHAAFVGLSVCCKRRLYNV